ncbi:MAG: sigma-70 family RNA polymerase sigma factor [Gammaproteobacteria bacterium]|nr:sigma-70 family RNA polymerase sigma factor [Gammaproteobacteria bacterium]
MADDELVRRCRAGDAAAWSTLVRRYQRLVYTVPRRAGLSDDDAADVFQVCFQRLLEHLDRLNDGSRVRAWLVTTAKRESLRRVERAGRFAQTSNAVRENDGESLLDSLVDGAPQQDDWLADLQELHIVRDAVDRLDARTRRFIELMFLQDEPLQYADIAAKLGIPEGSVGPTRARCLAKLRNLLTISHPDLY